MNTTEKQLIEKQSDYIFYLKRFISVSVNPESMVKFESEISALEQQLKKPDEFILIGNEQISCHMEQLAEQQLKEPALSVEDCAHRKCDLEPYHDGAIVCKKCNHLISQNGKLFKKPVKLSMF